jgi:hypothetical protein
VVRFLAFVAAVVLLVWAPNLVWLRRSTVYVENRSDSTVEAVRVFACDESIELGDLEWGESRLRLIPECGDTTLSVSTRFHGVEHQTCSASVDASMTHVEAWFDSPTKGGCDYGEPLLSPLLLTRLW